MPNLEELGLEENQLTIEGISQVAKLRKLKALTLSSNSVGAEGLKLIA